MKVKDINWIFWGMAMCVTFGIWQESVAAGMFACYATIFVLMTIAGWDDDTPTT